VRELAVRQVPFRIVSVPGDLPIFLKLLAEPNRLRILILLTQGELCVCDIEAALGLQQNLVSHHLQALKRAGLLRDRREGKWIYYRIEPQTLGERLGALSAVLDTRLAARPAVPCGDDGRGQAGERPE
jgi:ArsR family transcriptional regulator